MHDPITAATLNANEIAILGLVAEKPRYGYEIDKVIADRGMRQWTNIAFSSIYAVLRNLERKGLVDARTELKGNRARKLYAVTKAGRQALRDAVGRLIRTPANNADPLTLAVANIKVLENAAAAGLLAERREALVRRLGLLQDRMAENDSRAFPGSAIFDRALTNGQAEIEFIDRLGVQLGGIAAPKKTAPPGPPRKDTKAESEKQPMNETNAESEKEPMKEHNVEPKDTLF